jgi:hypothetical protein
MLVLLQAIKLNDSLTHSQRPPRREKSQTSRGGSNKQNGRSNLVQIKHNLSQPEKKKQTRAIPSVSWFDGGASFLTPFSGHRPFAQSAPQANASEPMRDRAPRPIVLRPALVVPQSSIETGQIPSPPQRDLRETQRDSRDNRQPVRSQSRSRRQIDSEEQEFYSPQPDSDIELVFGDPPMNRPLDNSVTSEQRMKLLRWLGMLGLCPRPPSYDPCAGNAYHQQSEDIQLDLEDDWNNGVFLSQLAALCSHGNRNEVKEVSNLNQ